MATEAELQDLPGVGPYTPAFTDVDVTPVGHGDE